MIEQYFVCKKVAMVWGYRMMRKGSEIKQTLDDYAFDAFFRYIKRGVERVVKIQKGKRRVAVSFETSILFGYVKAFYLHS